MSMCEVLWVSSVIVEVSVLQVMMVRDVPGTSVRYNKREGFASSGTEFSRCCNTSVAAPQAANHSCDRFVVWHSGVISSTSEQGIEEGQEDRMPFDAQTRAWLLITTAAAFNMPFSICSQQRAQPRPILSTPSRDHSQGHIWRIRLKAD